MFENTGELPFDDDYFMYGEDAYHAMRLRLRGFTHKMVPTSRFLHEGEGSSRKVWTLKIFYQERNRWLNFLIIFHPWTIARLAPLAVANIAGTLLYDPGNAHTRLKAYGWLLIHPAAVMKKRKAMQENRKVGDYQLLTYLSCKFYEEYLVQSLVLKKLVMGLNVIQYWYCRLLWVKTIEMHDIKDGTVL